VTPAGVSLFTYGTLILPEVWLAVTGSPAKGVPAVLAEYARYRLRDHGFPGIIQQTGAVTPGILYDGVDAGAMDRLDRFEEDVYVRTEVVVTDGFGRSRRAQAYVIPQARREVLSSEPWDPERFRREEATAFLETIGVRMRR
jgi:gamma-glutamylcyclotransferase (GGCT)/AIG2-like uncharacterized protein YtfP